MLKVAEALSCAITSQVETPNWMGTDICKSWCLTGTA